MLGWPSYPTNTEAYLLAARVISPRTGGGSVSSVFIAETLDIASARRLVDLNTTTFETGIYAFVQSLKAYFYFDRNSALAPDNINIANSVVGGGQWIRIAGGNLVWQSQAAWFIDPIAGNDENNGAALTPIRTISEWQRRIGFGGNIETTMVITIISTLPTNDRLNVRVNLRLGVNLTIVGIPTLVDTGSFTAVTNQNRATQTPYSVTDGSKAAAYWATHLNQRLILPNGAVAWTGLNLGASSVRVSRWLIAPTNIATLPGTTYSPIIGDTYRLETLPGIQIEDFIVTAEAGTSYCLIESLNLLGNGNFAPTCITPLLIISKCSTENLGYKSEGAFICASLLLGAFVSSGAAFFPACLLKTLGFFISGGRVVIDLDTYGQTLQSFIHVVNGGNVSIGFAASFDSTANDIAVHIENGNAIQEGSFAGAGQHLLWGTNNSGHGLTVRSNCTYVYRDGIKPAINGTLGVGREALIGGTDTLYAAVPFINPANTAAIVSFA